MKTLLQWLAAALLFIVGVPAIAQSLFGGLFLLIASALAAPPVWKEIHSRTGFSYRAALTAGLGILGMGLWVTSPEFQRSAAENRAKSLAEKNSEKATALVATNTDSAAPPDADVETGAPEKIETAATMIEREVLTGPQRNAVRSAKQYLSMTGFSRDGLIEQLSSDAGEGYSVLDATVAVDSLDVDWNENAVRSAKQYLDMTGFSCKGLIEQLSSSAGEKYTVEQATYGAHQAGAC
jgi:hypothetical protein